MQEARISVVVVTYKSSDFIEQTLDSILLQSYKDWELIITDDASPDNTVAVIRHWLDVHRASLAGHRIVLAANETNVGIAANCNRGITECRGKWIKLIAGDDYLHTDCLLHMEACAEAHSEPVVVCRPSLVDPTSQPVTKPANWSDLEDAPARVQSIQLMHRRISLLGPIMLIRRDYLLAVGSYDERFSMVEDYPFALRYLAEGHRFVVCDKELISYRIHREGISNTHSVSPHRAKMHAELQQAMREYLPQLVKRYGLYAHGYYLYVQRYLVQHKQSKGRHTLIGVLLRLPDIVRHRIRLQGDAWLPGKHA